MKTAYNTKVKIVDTDTINNGSRVGSMNVSPTPSAVFTDSEKLESREEVIVFNDASVFLYWSFDSNPTIGENTMPIPSGAIIKFMFDPNDPQDIYLLTSGLSTNVKVIELK